MVVVLNVESPSYNVSYQRIMCDGFGACREACGWPRPLLAIAFKLTGLTPLAVNGKSMKRKGKRKLTVKEFLASRARIGHETPPGC